jgi:hypothetical protein
VQRHHLCFHHHAAASPGLISRSQVQRGSAPVADHSRHTPAARGPKGNQS